MGGEEKSGLDDVLQLFRIFKLARIGSISWNNINATANPVFNCRCFTYILKEKETKHRI